ncbi:hypothetical protein MRS44_005617 [Fusarium solani]|uniref:Heterokaryon incompatibility protein-domain-containing protein n=1 Tax=Fusarium solani TaxID=169388 RepID=A0A9P9L978_FUSSL|nr:heterokaryon incompatibility protein-domain-containing protein [Fusarium solani]KAH7276213.1 heterokaryon incompatibility protein-domain-containing protein [Fusarium solani]KAJ3464959.1 hypothetical protein MRS44_005617 [Fusarium solani]
MNLPRSLVHRHMLQIVESATAYVPVPWIREQLLRRKGLQLHQVAGIFHDQSIFNSFAIAETLVEQDRFDEAEEILQTIIRGQRAAAVHDKAIELLGSLYKTWYHRLFLDDVVVLPDNVDVEATRILESFISLHLELSDMPSASCLDNLGRVLAWAGLDEDAEQAMAFKMLLLRMKSENGTQESFGCCDICGQNIPLEVAYFCRMCESMNVCQRCYEANLGNAACNLSSCFPHLIKVAPEQPTENIAGHIKAWLPPLLDTVRSWNLETGTEKKRMSPKRLFSPDDLQTAVRLCDDVEADDRDFISLLSVLHAVLMQSVQTDEFKTLFQAQEGPNVLSTIGLLAMVSNTRSGLTLKYQDAFCGDGFDEWDVPSLLPAEAENLDLEDSEMADGYGQSLAQVASRVIQLARPKHSESLVPTKHIRDSISDAEKGNALQKKRAVPQELYGALDLHSNPDAIRLVELLPGTGKDPIRCNLRIESRADEQLSYQALSYVWGNPKPEDLVNIELGGQPAPVTPNLYCALSYLRLASASRLLWIDALCINQANVAERNAQVAKMATIYQRASAVLIFLGDEESNKKRSENLSYADLFTFLNREVDIYGIHEDDNYDKKEQEQRRFREALQETGVRKVSLLRTFYHLCSREWWNRLWILQEYAIASTDPIFMLGTWQTSGSALLRDMDMLANEHRRAFRQEETRILLYNSTPYYPMTQASGVLNCRPARTDGFEYKSWLYPLLLSTHSWCMDRRDIIYGRHALMHPVLQQLLGPDYSLTTEELFEKVAIWLLMFERGVSMFWDFPVRLSPDLPSWVPDFSKPRQMSDVHIKWEVYEEKLCFDPYPTIYNGEMALYGRPIDTIKEVFRLRPQSKDFRADLVRRLWFLDIGLATLGPRYPLWRRHFLSAKLPGMYAEQPLHAWCTSAESSRDTSSSAFLLDSVSMKMLEEVIHSVVSPVKEKVDREKAIADCMAPIMGKTGKISPAFERARDSLRRLSLKLGSIKAFLLNTDTTRPDFLGAAFFDFDRLAKSLQCLHTPSLDDPTGLDAPQRRFVKAILEKVRGGTQSGSITHHDVKMKGNQANDQATPFPGLPLPNYGAIQSWVENGTAFTEEVELISTLLFQIACRAKESDCDMFQDAFNELEQITILDFLEDKKLKDWVVTFNKLRQQYSSRSSIRRSVVRSEGARLFEDRTFFVTNTGLVGVSGNGTEGVAVGDEVIMLDAAPMPMVLRGGKGSNKAQHEIVGYAHVRGLEPSRVLDLPEQWWPGLRLFKIV